MSDEQKTPDEETQHWGIDRRIPIATILALLLQFTAVIWFISSIDNRVNALEAYTAELRTARIRERLAVEEATTNNMVTKFDSIQHQLDRIDSKLDTLQRRQGGP